MVKDKCIMCYKDKENWSMPQGDGATIQGCWGGYREFGEEKMGLWSCSGFRLGQVREGRRLW